MPTVTNNSSLFHSLYGLAEVRKKNISIRSALLMPGSPYYKVAQNVTEWLSAIPDSKINGSAKQTVDN